MKTKPTRRSKSIDQPFAFSKSTARQLKGVIGWHINMELGVSRTLAGRGRIGNNGMALLPGAAGRSKPAVAVTRIRKEATLRTIRSADLPFVPAGHEDPQNPGVWKKVLFEKADLQAGHVQMVNWACLPSGNSFAPHYHEDMQEVFVIVQGRAELTVGGEAVTLQRGDAILIDPHQVHQMSNPGPDDVEYLAFGISRGTGGKTVLVDRDDSGTDSHDARDDRPVARL